MSIRLPGKNGQGNILHWLEDLLITRIPKRYFQPPIGVFPPGIKVQGVLPPGLIQLVALSRYLNDQHDTALRKHRAFHLKKHPKPETCRRFCRRLITLQKQLKAVKVLYNVTVMKYFNAPEGEVIIDHGWRVAFIRQEEGCPATRPKRPRPGAMYPIAVSDLLLPCRIAGAILHSLAMQGLHQDRTSRKPANRRRKKRS